MLNENVSSVQYFKRYRSTLSKESRVNANAEHRGGRVGLPRLNIYNSIMEAKTCKLITYCPQSHVFLPAQILNTASTAIRHEAVCPTMQPSQPARYIISTNRNVWSHANPIMLQQYNSKKGVMLQILVKLCNWISFK